MFDYFMCGLRIRSELMFPELNKAAWEGSPDVTINTGKIELGETAPDWSRADLTLAADGTRMLVHGVALYAFTNGRGMTIESLPDADDRLVRLNALSLGLGILLHQRGMLVLHGSVVRFDTGAVIFLGFSGDGKSTTAGALYRRGHAILSDELAVVGFDKTGKPIVHPSTPELRLWPESVRSLGMNPDDLPQIYQATTKRSRPAWTNFDPAEIPLRRVYVLDNGEQNRVESISPASACAQFIRHSLVAGILKVTGTAPYHFDQCVCLAHSVPVSRLVRLRSLDALDDLACLIENNVAISS
jgi:hypothetical protein